MGSYTLDGDQLAFSELASTRMACPDMEREAALLKALAAAATWRIEGAQLDLMDADGTAGPVRSQEPVSRGHAPARR